MTHVVENISGSFNAELMCLTLGQNDTLKAVHCYFFPCFSKNTSSFNKVLPDQMKSQKGIQVMMQHLTYQELRCCVLPVFSHCRLPGVKNN